MQIQKPKLGWIWNIMYNIIIYSKHKENIRILCFKIHPPGTIFGKNINSHKTTSTLVLVSLCPMNTENTFRVIRSCLYLYILFKWLAFLSHFACLNALESIRERTDPLDTDPVSKLLLKPTEPLSLFNLKPCSTSCRKKLYLENFEKSLRKTQLSAPAWA